MDTMDFDEKMKRLGFRRGDASVPGDMERPRQVLNGVWYVFVGVVTP